jgi:Uma2 family endonuclease
MASTPTRLMTFEEFEQLPWPDSARYELRHGELISLPPPEYDHFMMQQLLRDLLDRAAAGRGRAYTESSFRTRPDNDFRVADVAYSSAERWVRNKGNRYFDGAPDLVIEVLSPSNTATEISDRRTVCLESGSQEFWVVDSKLRRIDVSTPDGLSVTYKPGDEIPLFFGGTISVDAIFAEV